MLDRSISPAYVSPCDFEVVLPELKKIVLSNNTPIFFIENKLTEVLEIDFVFEAGKIHEPQKSIAHFCNNLIKTGTSSKNANEIALAFEQWGISLELSSNSEFATVEIKLLAKHLEKALELLALLFNDAVFRTEELENFSQRVTESLTLRLQQSNYFADRKLEQYLFGENHPYTSNINVACFKEVNVQVLKTFYERYYTKGNCKIFLVGKIEKNVFELFEKFFGKQNWNKQNFELKYPVVAQTANMRYELAHNADAVQTSIRIGNIWKHSSHGDYPKVRFLNMVLGGYFGSRLMKNIREKKGYTYGIYSYIQNNMRESIWAISTETGVEFTEKVIDEVFREFDKLKKKKIDAEELEQVKNYYMGMVFSQTDNVFSSLSIWRNLILKNKTEENFYHNINVIKNINSDEVQAIAKQYLSREYFVELIVK